MLDILEISDLSLHLTQTGRPLLEHFSFTLGAGDRAVLIGEEGNGKSTLLRYLAQPEALKGYCEAEGRVALRGRPGYLPQLLPEALRECTPADYLAEIPAHRASELLERLGLPQELAASERPVSASSSSWRVSCWTSRMCCCSTSRPMIWMWRRWSGWRTFCCTRACRCSTSRTTRR